MTKLKKKKSKQQAKLVVSFDGLDSTNFKPDLVPHPLFESLELSPRDYLWGVTDQTDGIDRLMDCVKQCKRRSTPKFLQDSTGNFAADQGDLAQTISLLLAAYSIGKYEHQMDPDFWRPIYDSLVGNSTSENPELLHESPVIHQLRFAELPLSLGLLFPLEAESESLIESGKNNLAIAFEELLDGDGLPHSQWLDATHLLLACWTRCLKMTDAANMECFDTDTQTQFEYFVRQTIRLTRKDESLVFSPGDNAKSADLILSALGCYHDDEDVIIASLVFPKAQKTIGKKKPRSNLIPDSSTNSEWCELAIMQTEWSPKSPRLTVAYQNQKIIAELSCGQVLFSGELRHELVFDSKPVSPSSDWEVVCWNSDGDGDFLELECELANGVKWQKHFFLARNDLFLLSGDAILGFGNSKIDFSLTWPMNHETGFGMPQDSNELFVTRKSKTAASIIPISLPEWRVARSHGNVSLNDSKLTFQMSGERDNIYCPFFMDLDPKRCRKPLTWRQLTVAEQLEIVPTSVATGFRVQVGNEQWLIYRSLAPRASRTVFGQNLAVEFYIGTFESDGTAEEIISVD